MPPPSRSSRKPGSVPPSPGTSRERYTIAAHHPARKTHPSYHHNPYHSMHSPHSPRSGVPRNLESPFNRMSSSPGTSYNLANAQLQLESHPSFALGSQNAPPFDNTKVVRQLTDARGIRVVPTIQAQVDKGFFKAEDDWTCYRRNYFSVVCSYSLKGEVDAITEPLSLISQSGQTERIQSLAMCLTAKVSGEDGKAIELVQHTPKRDKGPMGPPEMVELKPHPTGTLGVYPNAGSNIGTGSQTSPDYDPSYPSTSQQSLITANFDRLQFKRATANNGKRRAAQQYFHIVVELFAIISQGSSGQTRSVLVASRCSAPMVVRGRSPGHYQDERRGSSTSMGPGSGSNGEEGARDHSSSGPTGGSYSSMSGVSFSGPGSGKMGTGTYQVHHNSLNRSPSGSLSIPSSNSSSYGSNRSSYIKRHSGSAMSLEEAANIEEHPGYQYYPGALYDLPVNSEPSRPSLPSFRSPQFNSNGQSHSPSHDPFNYPHSSPNKLELHSQSLREDSQRRFQPLQSPSFSNHWHKGPTSDIGGFGRDCRPFQGVASSVGHYPPMSAQL
ncbi:MAG: hypothetical protein MMC33_005567 [Icmadophila ericetorum]|nr:hypothetical protein [Icmadophila ericetorum]